jgi:uroporphyrinogen-III synthase
MSYLLENKRIVLTRSAEQVGELATQLCAYGAEVLTCPAIEIVPPHAWNAFDATVNRLTDYDWMCFTSANAVRFAMARIQMLAVPSEWLVQRCIACIGPATSQALQQYGIQTTLVAAEYSAAGIVRSLDQHTQGKLAALRMLFFAGDLARTTLREGLRQRGAIVDQLITYRTIPGEGGMQLAACLRSGISIHAILFSSPSAVTYLLQGLARAGMPHQSIAKNMGSVICIGATTAEAAQQAGLPVSAVAAVPTTEGMVGAVKQVLIG